MPTTSGVAACQSDGTYTVTWTVTASGVPTNQTATVTQLGVSPYTPVSGLPTTVVGGGSVTFTQTDIPATTTLVSEDVIVSWDNTSVMVPTGFVTISGACTPTPVQTSVPPTTVPTTTTTTDTTTTTTTDTTTTTVPTIPSSPVIPPRNAPIPATTSTTTPQIAFTGANYPLEVGLAAALIVAGVSLRLLSYSFAKHRKRKA